jgi:arylsulfatase A-like enzyme
MSRHALAAFLFLGLLTHAHAASSASRPPNIVFILADDLGWTDLASYGSDLHQTPNLDRLAREGMRFTQAYSACTVCSPTRAAIMTGLNPARTRVTDWIAGHAMPRARLSIPEWTKFLDPSHYNLAEALKDAGYATGHFGKWHLGMTEDLWPERQGFDINRGGWRMGQPTGAAAGGNIYFSPYANPRLTDGPTGEHLDMRLAEEAASFMEANRDRPFFVNFWLYTVHTPLQAAPEKIEKYRRLAREGANHTNPTYAAMVEHMDESVGIVFSALERLGLTDNTIVIFTSDNGGLIGRNNKVTSNAPLRHGKGERYEGAVRVPLIVRYPPLVKPGSVSDRPAISMDFFPTFADLTGLAASPRLPTFDGISLVPTLRGDPSAPQRDTLYWHYPHYHTEGAVPYSAIRHGDWKLIHNLETDDVLLFNLADDLGEQNDLAAARPDLTVALRAQLATWLTSVGAQYPTLNPNYDPAAPFQR